MGLFARVCSLYIPLGIVYVRDICQTKTILKTGIICYVLLFFSNRTYAVSNRSVIKYGKILFKGWTGVIQMIGSGDIVTVSLAKVFFGTGRAAGRFK